jgi:hypothetical protein
MELDHGCIRESLRNDQWELHPVSSNSVRVALQHGHATLRHLGQTIYTLNGDIPSFLFMDGLSGTIYGTTGAFGITNGTLFALTH